MSSAPLIFHCHKQIAVKLKQKNLFDKVHYFLSVLLLYIFIVIMTICKIENAFDLAILPAEVEKV